MNGLRPIATTTTSVSRVEALPPLAGSIDSFRDDFPFFTPVTLVPSWNFKPCFSKVRLASLAISLSDPGIIRSRNSITFTSDPNLAQTDPSSKPIIPAPIKVKRFGTSLREIAPMFVTTRFSSTSIPGSGVASEPVATTIFFVDKVFFVPSKFSTSTSPDFLIVPRPKKLSTLFFLNKYSTPCVNPETAASFCPIIFSRLRFSSVYSIPQSACTFFAEAKAWDA